MHSSLKKTFVTSALFGTLMVGTTGFTTANAELAFGDGVLSFNIGVFSDYLDDGASASDNNAVVQGGMDYNHDSGFYFGLWTSTLGGSFNEFEFDENGELVSVERINPGQEVNVYAGYAWEFGEWGLDLSYTYAWYPELDDEDYGQISAQLLWGPIYLGLDWTTNADDGDLENDLTYRLGGEVEVIPTISVFGELGYYDPDSSRNDSYTFWSLGIGKTTDYGDFSLTYGSTDESGSQDLFVVGYSIRF